jgi:MFS family permease
MLTRRRVHGLIGIWASCNGLGFIVGPTTDGVIVDVAGWRLIFLLIVPMCIAALTLTLVVVPESSDRARRLDVLGQFPAVIALGTLAFAVIEGPRRGFGSTIVVAALTVCVILALAFRQLEKRGPLSLSRQHGAYDRGDAGSCRAGCCLCGRGGRYWRWDTCSGLTRRATLRRSERISWCCTGLSLRPPGLTSVPCRPVRADGAMNSAASGALGKDAC